MGPGATNTEPLPILRESETTAVTHTPKTGATSYHEAATGEVFPIDPTVSTDTITESATPPQEPIPDLDAILGRLPVAYTGERIGDTADLLSTLWLVARRLPAERAAGVLRSALTSVLDEVEAYVDEIVAEYATKPKPRRWTQAELESLAWEETPNRDDEAELEAGTFVRWLGSAKQMDALRSVKRQPDVRRWQERLDRGGRAELDGVLDRLPVVSRAEAPHASAYALCVGEDLSVWGTATTPEGVVRAYFEYATKGMLGTAADCESLHGAVPEGDLGDWLLGWAEHQQLRIVRVRAPRGAIRAMNDSLIALLGGGAE